MLKWWPEGGGRAVGHPAKRWTDDMERHMPTGLWNGAAEAWRIAAASREEWQSMEDTFSKAEKRAGRQQEEDPGCH